MAPLMFTHSGSCAGNLIEPCHTFDVGYAPEKTSHGHGLKPIESLFSTLDIWDPIITLSLSLGELLSTKTMSWVDILQLTRTVSQKPKGKVNTFRVFLGTVDFGGCGLFSSGRRSHYGLSFTA